MNVHTYTDRPYSEQYRVAAKDWVADAVKAERDRLAKKWGVS